MKEIFDRQIKFRAWHTIDKKMIPWEEFNADWFRNDSLILMQLTDLKDKDGNEIWEGDIVNAGWMHHGKPGQLFKAFIFYNKHIGSFRIGYDSLGGGAQDEIYFSYQIEVIGNLFENPELLKSKKKS